MPSYLFAPQFYCFHNAGTFSTKKETHLYNLSKMVDLDLDKYVCADNGTELIEAWQKKAMVNGILLFV